MKEPGEKFVHSLLFLSFQGGFSLSDSIPIPELDYKAANVSSFLSLNLFNVKGLQFRIEFIV